MNYKTPSSSSCAPTETQAEAEKIQKKARHRKTLRAQNNCLIRPRASGEKTKEMAIRATTPVHPSHKARIFSRDNYYYVKTDNPDLYKKNKYVTINAARLNAEFNTQSEYFLEHQDIASLLNKKSMFMDEKTGNILKDLTSRSSDRKERQFD